MRKTGGASKPRQQGGEPRHVSDGAVRSRGRLRVAQRVHRYRPIDSVRIEADDRAGGDEACEIAGEIEALIGG